MHARRTLVQGPEGEPLWVRLYVHAIGDRGAAMLVADDTPLPEPGSLTGRAFSGDGPLELATWEQLEDLAEHAHAAHHRWVSFPAVGLGDPRPIPTIAGGCSAINGG